MPTVLHVFRDDIDGLLGDHRIEPDQPLVLQLLHEVGLGQEGVGGHAALLQALHRHLRVPVVVAWGGQWLEEVTQTAGGPSLTSADASPPPPSPPAFQEGLTHPSTPPRTGQPPAAPPVSASPWGPPTRPPTTASGASGSGRGGSAACTAHPEHLRGQGREQGIHQTPSREPAWPGRGGPLRLQGKGPHPAGNERARLVVGRA